MARYTGKGCTTRGLAPAALSGPRQGLGHAICFPRASLVLTLYQAQGGTGRGKRLPSRTPTLGGSVPQSSPVEGADAGMSAHGPPPTKLNSVREPHSLGCPEQTEDAGEVCFTDVKASPGGSATSFTGTTHAAQSRLGAVR